MWKRSALRPCDREGDGSKPSVDRDRVVKREVKFRKREGNTYTLMQH